MKTQRLVSGRTTCVLALAACSALLAPINSLAVAKGTSMKYILAPVAGSSNYLVYTRYPASSTSPSDQKAHGELLVTNRAGHARTIAPVTNEDRLSYSLSGSMLVYESAGTSHWLNLKSQKTGTIPGGGVAAPHGWLTTKYRHGQEVLYQHTPGGKSTRLGVPIQHIGSPFLSVGSHDLVVSQGDPDDVFGQVKVMAFDRPGKFRTLIGKHRGSYTRCPSVTGNAVVCDRSATDGSGSVTRFNLTNSKATVSVAPNTHCLGTPAVPLGHSISWVEPHCGHHLIVVNAAGNSAVSRRTFAKNALVPAFGGVVAPSIAKHRLVLFVRQGSSRIVAGA